MKRDEHNACVPRAQIGNRRARELSPAEAYVKTNKYARGREREGQNERRAIFAKSQTARARGQR